jgi:hypothetical protein
MLATGIIDPAARTFDILGVNETATSITVVNGNLRLAYTDPNGTLVQLVKPLQNNDSIAIGDSVGSSLVQDNGIGGYAQKTDHNKFGTALTSVDWNNGTAHLTTKSFVDGNGITRTAVLLPVLIHSG